VNMITNLFRVVREPENSGVSMGPGPTWEIGRVEDAPAFFRALADLLPEGSILYLEDTCSKEGVTLLTRLAVNPQLRLVLGTIWPRPNFFHIPFNSAVASEPRLKLGYIFTLTVGRRSSSNGMTRLGLVSGYLRLFPKQESVTSATCSTANMPLNQFSHSSQRSNSRDTAIDQEPTDFQSTS
jgi:hypothetical protein